MKENSHNYLQNARNYHTIFELHRIVIQYFNIEGSQRKILNLKKNVKYNICDSLLVHP